MELQIITPDKTLFKGEAKLVQFPGTDGLFAVLNNHAPMIAALGKGKIRIVKNDDDPGSFININGGLVELKDNIITVLAE